MHPPTLRTSSRIRVDDFATYHRFAARFILLLSIAASMQQTRAAVSQSPISPSLTASADDSQALTLIDQALLALTNGIPVADVRLTGTAILAVPHDAVANVVIELKGARQSRITYSEGIQRVQVRNDAQLPSGEWGDVVGSFHRIPYHNTLIPPGVLNPISLLEAVRQPNSTVADLGTELLDGLVVVHLRYFHTSPKRKPQITPLIQHLATVDLYFVATSLQLKAAKFNTHPDHDAQTDIPTELRYDDYRLVGGVSVPFHIRRFIQGSLDMDLTITDAAINSGLIDGEFTLHH